MVTDHFSVLRFTSDSLDNKAVQHGFFGRHEGVSGGNFATLNCNLYHQDDNANVLENRRRILETFKPAPISLYVNRQVHGARVRIIDHESQNAAEEADGLVTKQPGMALGVLTADCAPVLFFCQHSLVIGACHAGWRGALSGVICNTVQAMVGLGASLQHIQAVVGPCIAQLSYEVSEDFHEQFVKSDPSYAQFFQKKPRHSFLFSLRDFVTLQLQRQNVGAIDHVCYDTYKEESLFFSFRRATHQSLLPTGGQLSLIVLNT